MDAGHGGWDNGAMFEGRKEKDDNLRLTLAVGNKLKELGNDIVYTRETDVYQSPVEKANIANRAGGDFFISFHRNASPMENQYYGVQTLLYEDTGIKSELANKINQSLAELGFQNLGNSVRKDLAVLRRTDMPALLLEVGFINSDTDNAIFDQQFDQIAQNIANTIHTTLNQQEIPVTYSIQTGLFRYYENAQRLADRLADWGYSVEIVEKDGYFAVLVGKFKQFERAEVIEKILQEDGFETWIVAR